MSQGANESKGCVLAVALLMLSLSIGLADSNFENDQFSGADTYQILSGSGSVAAQLDEDEELSEEKAHFLTPRLDSWFDWKNELQEKSGLQFGIAYTSLSQGASDTLAEAPDSASGGLMRISVDWELINRDSEHSGSLVVGIDHRHSYGEIAPSRLGASIGYLGNTGSRFSDVGWLMGDLYWRQWFNNGDSALIIGRFAPIEFFDTLGYSNPWTTFQNHSILHNSTIVQPDWSTGIAAEHRITEQLYMRGAISDANGSESGTTFFHDLGELYYAGEVGWSPSSNERGSKKIHLSAWHSEKRNSINLGSSTGIAFGANWTWKSHEPFFRASFSNGKAPVYNRSVTVGSNYTIPHRTDAIGVAANWGVPSNKSLDDQWTGELFYRTQLTKNLAITPSLQLLIDPALNPEEDIVAVGGLRARITF